MGKKLILAEKPSVGKDIARVLNCNQGHKGYYEGNQYIVTWALGHLVGLADPDTYDDRYKEWKLEDLPILPEQLNLVILKESSHQFRIIKELFKTKDITSVIIATDAGREGELVARWILKKIANKKPIQRLWISSVTDKAIGEGFKKLRAGAEYNSLYESAVARAEADWYVGINGTRALTTKYNAQLSCGRVQTPTLAILFNREQEIKNFIPQKYYGISLYAKGVRFLWQNKHSKEYRTFDEGLIKDTLSKIQGKPCLIQQIDKKPSKMYAPALYDLTELQRDANKLFGFSPKETLSIMQKLYEQHKILTYPRTDSRYLSSDIIETLPERLKACGIDQYGRIAATLIRKPFSKQLSCINDQKVTDHHAIIPTEQRVQRNTLTDKERKIYDLVVKRFLAVLMPPCEYEQTVIRLEIGGEAFYAKGKRIISSGYLDVYQNKMDEESDDTEITTQTLPVINKGEALNVDRMEATSHMTLPPQLFNEATLLSAMESPAKYIHVENIGLRKTLSETGGLGTVATRADIIEKLYSSFLIEKQGKNIIVTPKGKQLLELVPTELTQPELTGQWEQKLLQIAQGNLKREVFIADIKAYTKGLIHEIKDDTKQYKHHNLSGTRCPKCNKIMLEVKGKKGRMLVCQDRECGEKKHVAMQSNARCPECHKKMELVGEGDKRLFTCNCGYRERLSSFQTRKKDLNSALSKKEVSKYMNKQKKEASGAINNAFADALSNLKLDK